jgi:hypothetical protein
MAITSSSSAHTRRSGSHWVKDEGHTLARVPPNAELSYEHVGLTRAGVQTGADGPAFG